MPPARGTATGSCWARGRTRRWARAGRRPAAGSNPRETACRRWAPRRTAPRPAAARTRRVRRPPPAPPVGGRPGRCARPACERRRRPCRPPRSPPSACGGRARRRPAPAATGSTTPRPASSPRPRPAVRRRPGRRQRAARDPHHQHAHGSACQPQNGVGRPCRKRRDHRRLRGMALGTTGSFSHSRQTPSSIDSRADVLPSRTGRAAGGTGCSGGGPAGRHRRAGGVVRVRRLRDAAGVGRDAAAADRARAGPVRCGRGLDLAGPCDLDRSAGGRLRRAPAADRATGGGADRGCRAVQRGRDPAVAVRPRVGLGGGGRGARRRPVRVPGLADLDRGDLGCPVPRRPHAQARGHRLAVPDGDLVLQGRRSPRRLRLPAAARGVRRRCRPGRRRRRNGVHLPAAAVCAADDVRRVRRRPLADRLAHGRLPGGRGAGVGSGDASSTDSSSRSTSPRSSPSSC